MVPTRGDVVEDRGVRIERRVDEADGCLSSIDTLLVDERDDAAESGRRGRGAINQADTAVDSDSIVCAVRGYVRVASHGLRVVVLRGGVGWLVVCEVGCDGRGLVGWHGEDVAEPTAGVDDGFAGFLGCGDAGAWDDLRCSNGGDVWTAQILELAYEVYGTRKNFSELSYQVPGNDGLKVPVFPVL